MLLVASWPSHEATNKDRKSTRLNSSHANMSYAVFCMKKKNTTTLLRTRVRLCATGDSDRRVGPRSWSLPSDSYYPFHGSASRRTFFFHDTATTEIYTLSLHDALPI